MQTFIIREVGPCRSINVFWSCAWEQAALVPTIVGRRLGDESVQRHRTVPAATSGESLLQSRACCAPHVSVVQPVPSSDVVGRDKGQGRTNRRVPVGT